MNGIVQLRRMRLAAAIRARAAQALPAAGQALEIESVAALPLREPVSGRSYCLLELKTRSGLTGYGECPAVSHPALELARRTLQGLPASAHARVEVELAARPGLRAAVNMALLDILGKAANAPVFQLLGGPTRHKVRAMASLEGDSDAALTESLQRAQAAGYRAFLAPAPRPSARNQGRAYVAAALQRMELLRAAAGEAADFVLDGCGALSPGDAANLCRAFERFHLYWFDEPCAATDIAAARRLASESVTPLGFGRRLDDPARFQELLREDAIDVLRPSIGTSGITRIRKLAAIAETYYVAVAPYHEGGPVATAAALHLAAALPNFFIQQIPLAAAEADRAMRARVAGTSMETVRDGFAALPAGPGLGVTVNPDALRSYHGGAL